MTRFTKFPLTLKEPVGTSSSRCENSFQSLCWKATEVLGNDYSSAREQEETEEQRVGKKPAKWR